MDSSLAAWSRQMDRLGINDLVCHLRASGTASGLRRKVAQQYLEIFRALYQLRGCPDRRLSDNSYRFVFSRKSQLILMKLPKINCPHCAEAIPPEFVFEAVARIIKVARLPHAAQAHHLSHASTRSSSALRAARQNKSRPPSG